MNDLIIHCAITCALPVAMPLGAHLNMAGPTGNTYFGVRTILCWKNIHCIGTIQSVSSQQARFCVGPVRAVSLHLDPAELQFQFREAFRKSHEACLISDKDFFEPAC